MKTALRSAIEGYMLLPDGVVTEQQVVQAVPVSIRAVRGYLRRLVTQRILVFVADTSNCYRAGPRIRRWLKEEPKTLPGGNSRAYLEAKAQRDAIARQESALLRAVQLRRRLYGEDEA